MNEDAASTKRRVEPLFSCGLVSSRGLAGQSSVKMLPHSRLTRKAPKLGHDLDKSGAFCTLHEIFEERLTLGGEIAYIRE